MMHCVANLVDVSTVIFLLEVIVTEVRLFCLRLTPFLSNAQCFHSYLCCTHNNVGELSDFLSIFACLINDHANFHGRSCSHVHDMWVFCFHSCPNSLKALEGLQDVYVGRQLFELCAVKCTYTCK
jgi:hypothetical protein